MSNPNPPNQFGVGNTVGFGPGVSGHQGGRPKKPSWLAAKAEQCLAWVAGLGAGGARVEAQKAFRAALSDAWRLGHMCPHDADPETIMVDEVDALVEKYEVDVTTPATAPSKDEMLAAIKTIEWHYGKAAISVDVTENENANLLLEVLRARVIEASAKVVEPKQLPAKEPTG